MKTWFGFLQHGRSEDRIFCCHTKEMAAYVRSHDGCCRGRGLRWNRPIPDRPSDRASDVRPGGVSRHFAVSTTGTAPAPSKGEKQHSKTTNTQQTRTRANGAESGRPPKVPSSAWNVERGRPAPASDPEVRTLHPPPHHDGSAEFCVPIFRLPYTKPCFISDRATQLPSPPPPLSAHPPFTTPDDQPAPPPKPTSPAAVPLAEPPHDRIEKVLLSTFRATKPSSSRLTHHNSAADPPHPITLVLPHRSRFRLGRHQKVPPPPPLSPCSVRYHARTWPYHHVWFLLPPSPTDLHPVSSPSSPAAPAERVHFASSSRSRAPARWYLLGVWCARYRWNNTRTVGFVPRTRSASVQRVLRAHVGMRDSPMLRPPPCHRSVETTVLSKLLFFLQDP